MVDFTGCISFENCITFVTCKKQKLVKILQESVNSLFQICALCTVSDIEITTSCNGFQVYFTFNSGLLLHMPEELCKMTGETGNHALFPVNKRWSAE